MSQTEEKKPVVMAKCRRGSDRLTEGQSCQSKRAHQLTPPQSKHVSFKCADCGYSWTIPVGGSFTAC
jgi:transposase-like protein